MLPKGRLTMLRLVALITGLAYLVRRNLSAGVGSNGEGSTGSVYTPPVPTPVRPVKPVKPARPVVTPAQPLLLLPPPKMPGGLPAAVVVELPESYVPEMFPTLAERQAKMEESRRIAAAASAMERIKAGYAAAGKAPPGSITVPSPSELSAQIKQEWSSQALPPSYGYGAAAMVGEAASVGVLRPVGIAAEAISMSVGAQKAAERTKQGLLKPLVELILGPDSFGSVELEIVSLNLPMTPENVAGSLRRLGVSEHTVREFEGIVNRAGTLAEKAFQGGLTMGSFTLLDIYDSISDANGLGAQRIKSYIENQITAGMSSKIAEFGTKSTLKRMAGSKFSEQQIESIATGVGKDVQDVIDSITRSDKNYAGRQSYIGSVARESAAMHARPYVFQQAKERAAAEIGKELGAYLTPRLRDAVAASAAEEVANAFVRLVGSGAKISEKWLEKELTQSGIRGTMSALLPYMPSIGERMIGERIDRELRDVLPAEQRAAIAAAAGRRMAGVIDAKLRSGDPVDGNTLKQIGASIAINDLLPAVYRTGLQSAKQEVSATANAAMNWLKDAAQAVRGGVVRVDRAVEEIAAPIVSATSHSHPNQEESARAIKEVASGVPYAPKSIVSEAVNSAARIATQFSMPRSFFSAQESMDLAAKAGQMAAAAFDAGYALWEIPDRIGPAMKGLVAAKSEPVIARKLSEQEIVPGGPKLDTRRAQSIAKEASSMISSGAKPDAVESRIIERFVTEFADQTLSKMPNLFTEAERQEILSDVGEYARAAATVYTDENERAKKIGEFAFDKFREVAQRKASTGDITEQGIAEALKVITPYFEKAAARKKTVGDIEGLEKLRMIDSVRNQLARETSEAQHGGYAPVYDPKSGKTKQVKIGQEWGPGEYRIDPKKMEEWRRTRAEQLASEYARKIRDRDEKFKSNLASLSPVAAEGARMIGIQIEARAPKMSEGSQEEFVRRYGSEWGELTSSSWSKMRKDYEDRMKKAFGVAEQSTQGSDFARSIEDYMKSQLDLFFAAKMVGGASDPSLEGNQTERYQKLKDFGKFLDSLTLDLGRKAIPYAIASMPPDRRNAIINTFIASNFTPVKSTAQHRFELNQAAFARAPVVTAPSGYSEWFIPGLQGLDEIAAIEFGRRRRTS